MPVLRPLAVAFFVPGVLTLIHRASAFSIQVVRTSSDAAASAAVSAAASAGPGASTVAHLAPELTGEHVEYERSGTKDFAVPQKRLWVHGFLKALFVVSVAELFDKTWFMSLILALKLGWKIALTGGFTGLLLHCVLSALLGFGFSKLLKPSILHFITAGLFFLFTLLYAKDWYYAEPDSDVIESGKEEAAEAIGDETPQSPAKPDSLDPFKPKPVKGVFTLVAQAFIAVFIAEWGDRTQMAMIGLHSSLPVIPVFVGSALAFWLLTVSAVVVASFIARAKLSERLVMGTASLSFLVFAILALLDGLRARAHEGH